jgi:hypothetical protein
MAGERGALSPTSTMVRWRWFLVLLALAIVSFSNVGQITVSLLEASDASTGAEASESRGGGNVASSKIMRKGLSAAIYARPTFHEEVVSTMACMLHDEGFFVSVYIGSGFSVGRISIPYSDKRKRSADLFYGSCVDRWITITDPLAKSSFIPNLDLLIFSTYPIFSHSFAEDKVATSLLKFTSTQRQRGDKSTSVVLISHRVNETMHEQLQTIESFIPRNKLAFVFLSEHTELTMRDMLAEKSIPYARVNADNMAEMAIEKDMDNYQLSHFFPILPFNYIGTGGGRDVVGEAMNSLWGGIGPKIDTSSFKGGQVFSIQGNFGGRHAHRKDVKGTVDCLRELEVDNEDSGSTTLAAGPVHLDLIGHVNGHVETGELKYGKIRFLSDLSSADYYKAIANTHFMIAAVGEPDYYCCRATSSVPAALISGTPLVARKEFLKYYPCLNSAAIHSLIAKDTECESIKAARELTLEQYLWAREEISNCSAQFYAEGRRLLKAFAVRASR